MYLNLICNYLKSPNNYGTRKPTRRPDKLSPLFKRRIVLKVKKKTLSTSKILKSLVDAPCCTKTIRWHLNNEHIKHKKIIHRARLTIKHKVKRQEYACQYQTIRMAKINSSQPIQMVFRSTGTQKTFFRKRITYQGIAEEDIL